MDNYKIRECSLKDIEKIKLISEKTFYETFCDENSEEDMENYLKENFSYEQVEREIKKEGSIFYIVENKDEVLAYMKINFDKAQTEEGYLNTLEIQRIYILQEYKGRKIGKRLIEIAKNIAKKMNLITFGLVYGKIILMQ